jgi:hypothetical protein
MYSFEPELRVNYYLRPQSLRIIRTQMLGGHQSLTLTWRSALILSSGPPSRMAAGLVGIEAHVDHSFPLGGIGLSVGGPFEDLRTLRSLERNPL